MKQLKYHIKLISILFIFSVSGCAEFFVDSEPIKDDNTKLSSFIPKNLSIQQISINRFVISWDATTAKIDGYEVWRKKDNEGYLLLIKLPANVNFYVDTTEKPSITHYYKVRSYKDTMLSKFSNEVSTAYWTKIPAPSNLKAVASGINRIRLTWWDNTEDEEFFVLAYKPNFQTTYKDSIIIEKNSELYYLTNLKYTEDYNFKIRAVSSKGRSLWSNEVTTKPISWNSTPATPVLSYEIDSNKTFIKLIWQNLGNGINYELERKIEDDHYRTIYDGSSSEFIERSIYSGKKVYYRLSAYSTAEKVYSEFSNIIEITVTK